MNYNSIVIFFLLQNANLTKEDFFKLNSNYVKLLAAIRPQAVNIVDSFDLRDEILGSALGCWDGNAYQSMYLSIISMKFIHLSFSHITFLYTLGLFDEAAKSPLNKKNVHHESFHKYLKPLLKSNL